MNKKEKTDSRYNLIVTMVIKMSKCNKKTDTFFKVLLQERGKPIQASINIVTFIDLMQCQNQ